MVNGIEGDYIDLDTQIGSDVERAERGEGPERHETTIDPDVVHVAGRTRFVHGPAERCFHCIAEETAKPSCPCGGAGCSGPADSELHQCSGGPGACGVAGCPECEPAWAQQERRAPVACALSPEHVSAKLSVLCATLDESATPDEHLPYGRIRPALRIARELAAALPDPPSAPAGLTAEQTARYQDATATTLRRLVAEYSTAHAETLIAYYVAFHGGDEQQADALTHVDAARQELGSLLGAYVAYGASPSSCVERTIRRSTRPARAIYLARVLAHLEHAIAGRVEPLPLPVGAS